MTTSTKATPAAEQSAAKTEPTRRPTRQQSAIASALARSSRFVTAQDLHASLVSDGTKVGLATVYRTLQSLAADGEADMRLSADGESTYRACSTAHHHHLVCRECGKTEEVDGPAVERWTAQVAAEHGFSDVEHVVEITGRCASCSG